MKQSELEDKIKKYNLKIHSADKFTTPEKMALYHNNLNYYKTNFQQLLVKHVVPHSHRSMRTLIGHDDTVNSALLSPDGKLLFSIGNDKTIKIWSVATGECLKTIEDIIGEVTHASFSPNGNSIVLCVKRAIIFWEIFIDHELIISLEEEEDKVTSASFSPVDDNIVVLGSKDGTVKILSVKSIKCCKTLSGHTKKVTSAFFSKDGKSIISCSDDKTIKIWNVKTFLDDIYVIDNVLEDYDIESNGNLTQIHSQIKDVEELMDELEFMEANELMSTIIKGKDTDSLRIYWIFYANFLKKKIWNLIEKTWKGTEWVIDVFYHLAIAWMKFENLDRDNKYKDFSPKIYFNNLRNISDEKIDYGEKLDDIIQTEINDKVNDSITNLQFEDAHELMTDLTEDKDIAPLYWSFYTGLLYEKIKLIVNNESRKLFANLFYHLAVAWLQIEDLNSKNKDLDSKNKYANIYPRNIFIKKLEEYRDDMHYWHSPMPRGR